MKKIIAALESMGLVVRRHADPEGGFYGSQSWVEETPLGKEVGLSIFRHARGRDIWAGEVVPIATIEIAGVQLYSYEG
jgi:hypothetical protein